MFKHKRNIGNEQRDDNITLPMKQQRENEMK